MTEYKLRIIYLSNKISFPPFYFLIILFCIRIFFNKIQLKPIYREVTIARIFGFFKILSICSDCQIMSHIELCLAVNSVNLWNSKYRNDDNIAFNLFSSAKDSALLFLCYLVKEKLAKYFPTSSVIYIYLFFGRIKMVFGEMDQQHHKF